MSWSMLRSSLLVAFASFLAPLLNHWCRRSEKPSTEPGLDCTAGSASASLPTLPRPCVHDCRLLLAPSSVLTIDEIPGSAAKAFGACRIHAIDDTNAMTTTTEVQRRARFIARPLIQRNEGLGAPPSGAGVQSARAPNIRPGMSLVLH